MSPIKQLNFNLLWEEELKEHKLGQNLGSKRLFTCGDELGSDFNFLGGNYDVNTLTCALLFIHMGFRIICIFLVDLRYPSNSFYDLVVGNNY